MNLSEYQRTFIRMSFAQTPSEDDLRALGSPERFRMYRQMIRTRLLDMAKVAFRGTLEKLDDGAFEACFERFLASEPPRSPYIREAIADFGPFARCDAELLARGPAQLADLIAFEHAKWTVAYAPGHYATTGQDGVRELDFDGALVLNPTLQRLRLDYPVHRAHAEPEPTSLLVYRPPSTDEIRWYAADVQLDAILSHPDVTLAPLAQVVRLVAERSGSTVDTQYLESLASALTTAVSRSVILGVR